ncbi:MAG TPA: condensation domain-containing protein, partial [Thermobifida alba]|nr:condensation domain-containing protein [Thermobifida alba]
MTGSRIEDILPLSPLQQGMWFLSLYDEDGPDVYTVVSAFDIEGDLDVRVLRAAAETVLRRNANLRVAFRQRKTGEPVQIVLRDLPLPWTEHDLTTLPPQQRDAELARIMERAAAHRFRLQDPPLLSFRLVRLAERRHRFIMVNHHILLDGWSMPLLAAELFRCYAAGGDDRSAPATPYRAYLEWIGRQDPSTAEKAWLGALEDLDGGTLVVPGRQDRPARPPRRLAHTLGAAETARLTGLARDRGLTLGTLVQGAWAGVLSGITGRRDVVFGTTVSGRPAEIPGVEQMIGLFINTLPTRVRLDPAEPVAELLARTQSEQAALLDHQYLGLTDIQRAAGHGDLFDTLTVVENYPGPAVTTVAGLRITAVPGRDATHYPLTLVAVPGDELQLWLDYRDDLVADALAEQIAERAVRFLTELPHAPRTPFARFDLLGPAQRTRLLEAGRGRTGERPVTLPGLLARQVAARPDAVAVSAPDGDLTYAELDERTRRRAAFFADRGVGPETVVALVLPRSVELVECALAVMRAGGAYLPVDPDYPAERIAFMLADARPALAVTGTDRLAAVRAAAGTVPVLDAAEAVAPAGVGAPE